MNATLGQAGLAPPTAGALPPPPTSLADPAKPLTLDDCLRLALANDRHLRIADRRVLIARDRTDEAVYSVYPQLALDGRYEIRSNDMGTKNGTQGFAFGRRHSGMASLNLLVPIYDFGGSAATKRSLERAEESIAFTAVAQRQLAAFQVRLAYYRLLEARTIETIVTHSLKTVDRQRAVAADFHANGLVARNDVLAVEVQKAQRTDEMLQARNNRELATATLNRLLGLPVDRPTQVVEITDIPAWADSYEKTLGLAIDQRAELAGLRKQIAMAREEYTAVRSRGYNPNLYAYGSYNGSTDDTLLNQQWLVGGIGLKFPLFDGGVTYARLQRKTREIAELIDLHDDRADDTVLEVKQAWLNARTRREQLPVAQAAIRLAEENLAAMQDQYAQGLATSADVLMEEDRLSRSRGAYSRALYGCHEAVAALRNAIGAPFADGPADAARDPALPVEAVPPAQPAAAPASSMDSLLNPAPAAGNPAGRPAHE